MARVLIQNILVDLSPKEIFVTYFGKTACRNTLVVIYIHLGSINHEPSILMMRCDGQKMENKEKRTFNIKKQQQNEPLGT